MNEFPGPTNPTQQVETTIFEEFDRNKKGVFAMILHEKKTFLGNKLQVLLVLRNDIKIWNLPGGGIEKNEDPVEGVIRETEEETGLKVGILRKNSKNTDETGKVHQESEVVAVSNFASPLSTHADAPKGDQRHDMFDVYFAVIMGGKLTLNEEAEKIRWFDVDKLPKNIYLKHAVVINIATSKDWDLENHQDAIHFAVNNHSFVPKGLG